jgi:hypothetical protein
LSTKKQGKTSQGISAAGFLPEEPYNLESDTESKAKDAPGNTLDAANRAAMRILADNRSVRGTMASRLALATMTAEAAPSSLGSKAPNVQQGSGREAHQKTQEEAHYPAYRSGRRPTDATKVAGLIAPDNNNGLLDLKTAPATKPTSKPIITRPLYKKQDLNINRCNGLNRLNKLQGALA